MSALADQSTMPVWPVWVWLLLFAAVWLAAALLERRSTPQRAVSAARTTGPGCWTHNCRYPGRVAVLTAYDNVPVWVCHGCHDEGTVRGYYRPAA